MLDLGPHSDYIYISFALSGIAILGMLIWVYFEEAIQRRKIKVLEAQGVVRRSATSSKTTAK